MSEDTVALLKRVESLEQEVISLKTRLDEPLRVRQARRIKEIWGSRTCAHINILGTAQFHQPVFFLGLGKITIHDGVQFGFHLAPGFYEGHIYVNAGSASSHIELGSRTHINNNSVIVSEGEGITIGDRVLMGAFTEVFDSDFHALDPDERSKGIGSKTAKTNIGNNVFIGTGCKILKGVSIGSDTVIGAGSVVSKSVPANAIAAGNPARILRKF